MLHRSKRGDNAALGQRKEGSEMENRFEHQLEESSMRFNILMDQFEGDLGALRRRMDGDSGQTWRRAYCTTLFSYLECIMDQLHEATLILKRSQGCGPPEDEEHSLREMREIDQKCLGELPEEGSDLFLEDLAYAVEEYAGMNNADFKVDRTTEGWVALESSQALRSRLAHPKHAYDIIVSEKDIEATLATYEWLGETLREMHSACLAAMERQLELYNTHLPRAGSDQPECK
jgi:hypothetical protein